MTAPAAATPPRRAPRPVLPMPTLAFALLLLLAPRARAQPQPLPAPTTADPPTINVTLGEEPQIFNVTLAYNTTQHYRVVLAPAAPTGTSEGGDATPATASNRFLIAHFAALRPETPRALRAAFRNGLPYIVLAATAASGDAPLPLPRACGGGSGAERCACGIDPAFLIPPVADNVTAVDRAAFYTRAQAAFVRLPGLAPGATARLAVTNFAAARKVNSNPGAQPDPGPAPDLSGQLVVRAVDAANLACPVTVPRVAGSAVKATELCSGHGDCERGVCVCNERWAGRFCAERLLGWPPLREKNGDSLRLPNGVMWSRWKQDADQQRYQFTVTLPPFASTWVRWRERNDKPKGDAVVRVRVHKGMAGQGASQGDSVFSIPRLRVFLQNESRLAPEQCGISATDMPNDVRGELKQFSVVQWHGRRIPVACKRQPADGRVDAVLFADATGYEGTDPRDVSVEFLLRTYDQGECQRDTGTYYVPFFLVPMCLAIMAVSATVIIVLLFVDRRHGFTNAVDCLSVNELNRMHPALSYGTPELPISAVDPEGSSASVRPECSICLCPFEVNDSVRQLKCGHTYHCECVDPWLTKERASCPTCRAKARVDELSDRRHLRYLVQLGLWPITALRRQRERWRTRRDVRSGGGGSGALDGEGRVITADPPLQPEPGSEPGSGPGPEPGRVVDNAASNA